ncbi:alpha/beta fold hydrolase [Noviherbaspirillum cavernae]|uniref:Alpha/beta fold hydrolase n=1 Tax=Noviherbaspirillum cavernae TaxID=2320862 RepID=A0A418X2W6_9BURK|nr:alpha/beta fold hydrolase [Noviherbaspirillum cavernae]RJG06803.1 alpha/beta fold hydrolase [Noviherbaspirillum cavernae]
MLLSRPPSDAHIAGEQHAADAHLSSALPLHESDGDAVSPASIDRLMHAFMGRLTSSISPSSLALAYIDWASHLAQAPGKWGQLAEKAMRKTGRLQLYAARASVGKATERCIEPLPHDRRFNDPAWQRWPYNVIHQSFLLHQQWWHNATTGIGGVSPHHQNMVSFVSRQLLDMMSPVNFIATNPEVLETTIEEGGQNFVRGAATLLEDWERAVGGKPPAGTEAFQPGKQLAVTRGQVVYRNRLMELIQYTPATPEVLAEPILIVPAWIMKYYVLDLSPANSLVKYLVERGHTVFMISWHNPTAKDRDMGMDDYLHSGVLEALNAVQTIVPERPVNAVGYCLGGTLVSIMAAYFAQREDSRLNSMTLFAAQTDFTEAGELRLFIDDSQLNFLDDIMWDQGYLDNRQMAGAFQLLRSHDLIWSRIINQYLMGRPAPMNDLMAWNADATRMPYRMQSEYLRSLFLNNDLYAGRYKVRGRPVALSDIDLPIFVVATESDHVAPWRSVYKINVIVDADLTFLLTNGGHNAGIVSEPGHEGRHFRVSRWLHGDKYVDPDRWFLGTPAVEGSWWPVWADWLASNSEGWVAPPAMGAADKGYPPLGPAPGSYVLER